MVDVRVTHTAWLEAGELADIRALLDGAFRGRFSDDDFEHGLGGIHALVLDGEALVAHGSVVMRRLLHEGRALRTGYVEAVAVRADRRRLGHAGLVMEQLERVVRGGYDLGALSASSMARSFLPRPRLAAMDGDGLGARSRRPPAAARRGGQHPSAARHGDAFAGRRPRVRLARRRRLVTRSPRSARAAGGCVRARLTT
jgi:GNAT superfamily N-acetyltransferase